MKGQFVSKLFLTPKPDGFSRLILNLKILHTFTKKVHIQFEDIRTDKDLINNNCYMATLDSKDAYYLIPVVKSYRKYLRFQFKGQLFEFTCLPFGLNTASLPKL